jgi:hypothetical protein
MPGRAAVAAAVLIAIVALGQLLTNINTSASPGPIPAPKVVPVNVTR